MFRQFRLAAVFSLSFVLCDPAMAADQVVTINANSGAGSLRQAISDVTAGGNITFNLPAGNETITIASELSITKALTINGANASGSGVAVTVKVTTPGTSAWRVFTITASGSTINIQNMTMLGGSTGGSYGGVMQINSGATVNLTGITMSNGKSNYGGGVFLTGATTNLVVTNSTLSNNSTTGNHGGWVYNEGSYVEVNSCTFSGNTGVCGGAIFNAISSARLLVSSCEFTGNSGNGGAVYNEGTATITGSTIYGNTSTSIGGAITSWGAVTISSSTIFGNAATTDGGGIYKGGANDLIITSSTISGNTSGSNKGGGIFNITGSCYLLNSIIINNFASAGADLYNASGSTYAYYCWYHGTSGTISSQATAPDVTMAYSPGDLGVPLNNGGSTKTMEVSPASPAPDNGAFVYYNATDGYYFLDNQSTPVSHKLSAWATSPTVTPADKITADQRGITIGNLPTIGSYYLVPVHVASTLGTLSADYYTLHDAADAVNTGTHQGTITVTINGSIIETGSVVFNASGSGSSGYTSISIYPTATGLSVSGNMATPLIDLNGADNVTIDGRVNASGSAKDLTISNTNTSTTAGTSTIRFINDACANTVKYCILKGSSTATTNSGVIYFATAGSGPGNDNNTVDQNDITCALDANRLVNVIYAYGTSGKENSGNVISNNNIFNFMRRGAYSNGLLIYQNNTAYTVSGNSFYETTTFVPTASGGIYFMIWINNTGVNYIISGNYIGGTSASCGGSALTKTSSPQYDSEFNGIYLNTGAGSASNIQGNTIANITWNNSGNGRCTGIETEGGGDFNIGTTAANTIGASTGNGSLTYSYQTGGAFFYGMYLISHGTTIVSNNILGSITGANTSDHSTSVYGIYKPGYGTTTIINNSIGSTTTANSIQTSSTSIMDAQNVVGISCSGNAVISNNVIANLHNSSTAYEGQVAGISTSSGAFTVANNTVRDLSIANYNTYSENHASVIGICNWSNSNAHTISGNKIYNLSNTYNSFSGCIIGLFFNASSAGSTVSGNFIYGLAVAPGATDGNIYGIKIEGGATTYSNNIVSLVGNTRTTIYGIYETGISGNNNNFYFNTVYLGGTLASGSTNKSYALYSAVTTNTRDFRNNIFSNARSTTGGASLHYSAWFNYAVNTNLTLDYNDYYASGTGGVMGYYNSANATTLPLVTGNDANSISVNPNFPSAGGTLAANYKVTAGLPGTASGTGISTDFAGTARSLTAPTMGAYEYIPVIYYVKATGSDANDGLSWANAKATLQAALDLVVSTDQIWVAAGTYTPTSAYDLTNTPRYYHFRMKYGVSIYGGFAGTESAVSERTNFGAGQLHETKLSGDLLNNDNFDYANGGYQGTTGDDNCYHVIYNPTVLIPLLTNTAVLDGFTIKGGNATGGNTFNQGSGICNSGDNNSHQSNNPVIRNCIITRNYATEGAVYIGQECNSLNILNSTFTENYSESGGGVFTWECNPTITNTLFYKNKSIHGGAICFQSNILSTPSVINCTITGNTATFEGGGISNMGLSTNSSFRNCIIWGNTAEYLGNQIRITHGTAVTLNYSCYSNGAGDISNSSTFTATDHDITTNPQFVNSGGDDYRIKGYSPCADAGLDSCNSETFDIRGAGFGRKLNKSTGVAGTIDMGAYEFKSGTDPDAVLVTATSGPVSGYYGTLKAAFDAINAGTHQGTVTVTIIASTTETASAILNESSDPANYSSVYIYPASAGLNISGNLAAPLIDLNGTHNVTIDGRVNATGSVKDLTIINTSNSTACGTSTIRFINDACSNSVKYCTLKGSSLAHSSNWCGAIVYFSSGVASGNDDNSIDHNNITNATNRPICGVFSNGTAGAANSGNTISNNNLYDLLSFENHSSMIFIYLNNASWTINGNRF